MNGQIQENKIKQNNKWKEIRDIAWDWHGPLTFIYNLEDRGK